MATRRQQRELQVEDALVGQQRAARRLAVIHDDAEVRVAALDHLYDLVVHDGDMELEAHGRKACTEEPRRLQELRRDQVRVRGDRQLPGQARLQRLEERLK